MAEVARREDAESTEKCPLWGEIQQLSNPGSPIELADNAAGAALDHASPKGWGVDKRMSLNGDRPTANGKDATKNRITRVTEDVLEDVGVRRVIRNAILSGKIDEAIELITHHLPTFLPVTTPDISIPSPAPNTQSGSHDPSQTKPIVSSSILPEPSSSGATTPVEPAPEPVQPSEKAAQKIDVPAIDASQAGSPKRTSAQETPVLDGVPRRHTSSSLGGSVNPVHILLNLRVQQFLEAVRTVPLESNMDEQNGRGQEDTGSDVKMHAPGSPTASEDSGDLQESHVTSSPPTQDVICSTARQQRLFELASQLYQKVKGLKCSADREIYEKEIEQVGY
ncbi:hypothetical protein FRC07_000995 [Ceratobasidium sp. 392]|nr:hypothetical protein FRC07_000995 [Ceratobasidium sp. 392]